MRNERLELLLELTVVMLSLAVAAIQLLEQLAEFRGNGLLRDVAVNLAEFPAKGCSPGTGFAS